MNKIPILLALLLLFLGCASSGKNKPAEDVQSNAKPQNADAYLDSAVEYLEKAITLKPDLADELYETIVKIYFLRNEEEKAFEYALKIMVSRLDAEELAEKSADIAEIYHFELKNYEKAIEYYKKAIELEPDDATLHNNLGFAYIKRQDWDKALECAKKIIDLKESLEPAYAYHIMAISYAGKKEYDKSLEYYDKSIEYFKNFLTYESDVAEMYSDMSNIYEAKGDKEKAMDFKEKAKNFKFHPRIFPEKP